MFGQYGARVLHLGVGPFVPAGRRAENLADADVQPPAESGATGNRDRTRTGRGSCRCSGPTGSGARTGRRSCLPSRAQLAGRAGSPETVNAFSRTNRPGMLASLPGVMRMNAVAAASMTEILGMKRVLPTRTVRAGIAPQMRADAGTNRCPGRNETIPTAD